jgi:putative ATP-binding cassette transporter
MELMRFLLSTSWPLLAIAVGTGMLSGGSSAALIAVISHALNIPKGGGGELLVWGFVALAVVALVSSIVSQVVLIRLSQEAIYRMRMQLLRQILQTELRQLETIGSPRLMASLTEDIHAITDAINRIPFLCIDIATVLGCLVYITWLSWSGLVLLIALCALAALSCIRLIQRGQIWLRRARDEEDHLFAHFRSATEGIKELKLHSSRSSAFLREEVDVTAGSYCGYSQRGLTLFAVSTSVGKLIFFFAAGMILFALPRLLSTSGAVVSGSILTFAYLMLPMDNIVNNLPYISKSDIALQKIRSLGLSLEERPEPKEQESIQGDGWEVLKLREVVYPYRREEEDEDFILGPISLNILKGELIFIVGGNGSGKSTLAKLLTGLYVPASGSIELDGQVVNDANRGWYREHWSAIYSDFYLF